MFSNYDKSSNQIMYESQIKLILMFFWSITCLRMSFQPEPDFVAEGAPLDSEPHSLETSSPLNFFSEHLNLIQLLSLCGPRSINVMEFSVTRLFWPYTNWFPEQKFLQSEPGRSPTRELLTLRLFLPFSCSPSLGPVSHFKPSCVAVFLLPSHSISVLISMQLIPLSLSMPVSYLTVSTSVFQWPLVLYFPFLPPSLPPHEILSASIFPPPLSLSL